MTSRHQSNKPPNRNSLLFLHRCAQEDGMMSSNHRGNPGAKFESPMTIDTNIPWLNKHILFDFDALLPLFDPRLFPKKISMMITEPSANWSSYWNINKSPLKRGTISKGKEISSSKHDFLQGFFLLIRFQLKKFTSCQRAWCKVGPYHFKIMLELL